MGGRPPYIAKMAPVSSARRSPGYATVSNVDIAAVSRSRTSGFATRRPTAIGRRTRRHRSAGSEVWCWWQSGVRSSGLSISSGVLSTDVPRQGGALWHPTPAASSTMTLLDGVVAAFTESSLKG